MDATFSSLTVSQFLREGGIVISTTQDNGLLVTVKNGQCTMFTMLEDRYGTAQTALELYLSTRLVPGFRFAVSAPSQRGNFFGIQRQAEGFPGTLKDKVKAVLEFSQEALRNRLTQKELKESIDFMSDDGDYWTLPNGEGPAQAAYLQAAHPEGRLVEDSSGMTFYKHTSMLSLKDVKENAECMLTALQENLDGASGETTRKCRVEKPSISGLQQPDPGGSSKPDRNHWLSDRVITHELLTALTGDQNQHSPDLTRSLVLARNALTKGQLNRLPSMFSRDELPVEEFISRAKSRFEEAGFDSSHVLAHIFRFHGQIDVDVVRKTLRWKA